MPKNKNCLIPKAPKKRKKKQQKEKKGGLEVGSQKTMWIQDISKLLNTGALNYHTFNPCLLHWQKNLYVVVYRIAWYDLPIAAHCWKVWNSAYRLFKNPELVSRAKYRQELGPRITHCTQNPKPISTACPEFDSTGLALLECNNGNFSVRWNIPDLFPNEMNQDARIQHHTNKNNFVVIYNVFDNQGVKLRYRTVDMTDDRSVHLSQEEFLFAHIYRSIEKHACFEHDGTIQYAISPTHLERVHYNPETSEQTKFELPFNTMRLQHLNNKYGANNILYSLSTPSVHYSHKTRLGCGHAKFLYKQIHCFDFLQAIDLKQITQHGKYIYFMFLYEYDAKTGTVERISSMFIPSVAQNHLPYLLVMPMGLTVMHNCDKFTVSFGEGDCRLKLLTLSRTEVEYLLNSMQTSPCFLTEQMHINHIGYFNSQNGGDDAFEIVFRFLYKNTPHQFSFGETNKHQKHTSVNVMGGGDTINSFFASQVSASNRHKNIAVSVGIPYIEFESFLTLFSAVYMRNPFDVKRLSAKHNNLHFVSDLAYLLPQVYGPFQGAKLSNTVGIILARTYYNEDYLDIYKDFVKEMVVFVELVTLKSNLKVCFIPFGINVKKKCENDLLIIQDVWNGLSVEARKACEIFQPFHKSTTEFVRSTYFKIASMTFNVCTRFHSHVFSSIHAVPFISLTCGRKCIEFMRDIPECLFLLKKNHVDLPIEVDGTLLFHFFAQQFELRQTHSRKLAKLTAVNSDLIAKFADSYLSILRKHCDHVQTVLFLPPKHEPPTIVSSPSWCHKSDKLQSGVKTLPEAQVSRPLATEAQSTDKKLLQLNAPQTTSKHESVNKMATQPAKPVLTTQLTAQSTIEPIFSTEHVRAPVSQSSGIQHSVMHPAFAMQPIMMHPVYQPGFFLHPYYLQMYYPLLPQ
jgi:polysaccharide pyruvyl transferase WcaK-like protein